MVGDVEENSDGSPIAMATLKTKTPSQWSKSNGDEHLELQIFAIHCLAGFAVHPDFEMVKFL